MGMPQDSKLNQSMEKTRFRRGGISDSNKQREKKKKKEEENLPEALLCNFNSRKTNFFSLHALRREGETENDTQKKYNMFSEYFIHCANLSRLLIWTKTA